MTLSKSIFSGVLAGTVVAMTPLAVSAATITGWNTSNVDVDTSDTDGVTGTSEVYDETFDPADGPSATATTSGRIVFTPPEALSPGIKVENLIDPDTGEDLTYPDTGQGSTLTLDGCLMTSNPTADCTSGFQSGKRIKQQVTGFDPVDLVFDVDNTSTADSFYQVFGRLINVSGIPLDGFKIELGFGIGDQFVASTGQVTFSTEFTAQPNNSGLSSTTQFPFGLFGDADDSPNFLLDGFFASDRTGLTLTQDATTLTAMGSSAYYGDYFDLFGLWNTQQDVPKGLFWDFDDNPDTDDLLMAWQIGADGADEWELRRTVGQTCDTEDPPNCTFGVTLPSYETGTFAEIVALLSDDQDQWIDIFNPGPIEDLANLNLNYALVVGDMGDYDSFTIRTTAYPGAPQVVPLPGGAPLMAGGLALLAFIRRRSKKAAAA